MGTPPGRYRQGCERHEANIKMDAASEARHVCRSKKVSVFGAMEDIRNDFYSAIKPIHHASIHPVILVILFLIVVRSNFETMLFFALNMTWTRCEVCSNLDFEPSEKEWRAAGHWGGRSVLGALHWKSCQRISASDLKLQVSQVLR